MHSCAYLIGLIFLLSGHWLLEYGCDGILGWFLVCLYLLCGCLVVDFEVNVGIWYDWILLCLLCCLELMGRVLWGIIFVSISSISAHSCDIDVLNRTNAVLCEDKLILFIAR